MWKWVGIAVTGICTFVCLYLTVLAFSTGENAALFAAFGLFWGAFFSVLSLKAIKNKGPFLLWLDGKISGKPAPTSFVPHWFLLLALTLTGIAILAAILIPVLR